MIYATKDIFARKRYRSTTNSLSSIPKLHNLSTNHRALILAKLGSNQESSPSR